MKPHSNFDTPSVLLLLLILISSCVYCHESSTSVATSNFKTDIWITETQPNIPFGQLHALHTLYDVTNGENWNWTRVGDTIPWNFSTPDPNPCVDKWQGITCNTQCFTGTKNSYCQVIELDLQRMNMSGTLPDSLEFWGNLTTLTLLSFGFNHHIVGTLPNGIGNLLHLEELYLNNLNGLSLALIPDIFQSMANLQILDIAYSQRNGTIPSSVFTLPNLQYLDLAGNTLEGSLSHQICEMNSISYLFLAKNKLTDSLPDCIGNLKSLNTLELTANFFTGFIPASLYTLNETISIYLDVNFFEGNISRSINQLTSMWSFVLNGNLLTGSIPEEMGELNQLKVLALEYNAFYGHLPCGNNTQAFALFAMNANLFTGTLDRCNFSMMVSFNTFSNYLTGTIPQSLNSSRAVLTNDILLRLEEVSPILIFPGVLIDVPIGSLNNVTGCKMFDAAFSANFFTGSVPPWIFESPFLVYIYLDHNMLSGSIPKAQEFSVLSTLYLDTNYLTGSIPQHIYKYKTLVEVSFAYNKFTGTISPDLFINNLDLNEFSAYGNMLSGSIPELPDSVYNQTRLSQLNLYSNQLTGSLPWGYFTMPRLATFSVSDNCLSGDLSDQICQGQKLQSLILDGISSSTSCQKRIFPKSFPSLDSFRLRHRIKGHIPSCLFALPHLENLYLSGNGLIGSIASNITVSSSLKSLRLSYNQLTGTIPDAIQQRSWETLDLSYNKLKGHISSSLEIRANADESITQDASIYLEDNRLSGDIPSSLRHIKHISILNSNIFYCNLNRKELPVHDPKTTSYSCGSENIEILGIIFLCVIVGIGLVFIYCCLRIHQFIEQWWNVAIQNIKDWYYAIKTEFVVENTGTNDEVHSQLTNELHVIYRVIRMSVVIGLLSVVVMMPLFRVLNIFSSMYENKYGWEFSAVYMSGTSAGIVLLISASLVMFIMLYLFDLKDVENDSRTLEKHRLTHILTNGRIVYIACVVLVNFVCMILLNSGYIAIVVYADRNQLSVLTQISVAAIKLLWNDVILWRVLRYFKTVTRYRSDEVTSGDVRTMISCLLFNNIIAPCLGTLIVSPSCFYNALVAINSITAHYTYCMVYVKLARQGVVCTSYGIGESSFSPPFIYGYNCASLLPVNYAAVFVYMALFSGFILPLLKIAGKLWYDNILQRERTQRIEAILKWLDPFILLWARPFQAHPPISSETTDAISDLSQVPNIFARDRYVVRTIGLIAILISFGVLYPPVAATVAIAIIASTLFELLNMGRILSETKKLGYAWYKAKLILDLQGMGRAFQAAIFPMTLTASLLYGALVFDTIGDKGGFHNGVIAGVVMAVVPCILWMGFAAFRILRHRVINNKSSSSPSDVHQAERESIDGIQLSIVVENPLTIRPTFETEYRVSYKIQ